jgi:hypothetical protein
MAVAATDLLEPAGDLSPELFPGLDTAGVATLLAGYITDAAARIPAGLSPAQYDAAVRAWAYSRAYRAVALRLSRDPASSTLEGEGSTTITAEQIRTFKSEAEKWAADFAERTTGVDTNPRDDFGGTVSVPNSYAW